MYNDVLMRRNGTDQFANGIRDNDWTVEQKQSYIRGLGEIRRTVDDAPNVTLTCDTEMGWDDGASG